LIDLDEHEVGDRYTINVVELTDAEVAAAPEFEGF
jgi:hypothetical protein